MEQVKYSYVPTIELDKIKQGMAQVEKILNNKNLTTDQTQRFTELFTKLKAEAKKYTAILQSGFNKDSDLSALEKSGKTLKTIMTNISTEFSDIDFSELEKTFSSSSQKAKELRETIADIKNQLRDVGGQDLKNRVIGSTTKMKKVSSSSAVGKFEAGFNSGDYSMMEEAYGSLVKNAKTFKNPEKIKVVNESLKEMKAILDQIKQDPAFQDLTKELQRVQNELDKTNKNDLEEYEKQLVEAGKDVKRLTDYLDALRKKNEEVAESQKDLTDEFDHFKDQAKYLFSIGSAIQIIKRAITDAFQSVKELDAAMTQTAVVSEYTVDQMWETLPEKTAQANKFGASIKGVYEVETLYYQQGLKTNEVTAVGAETLKMAKISGLDYAAATDAMTAALRGFNMEVNAINSQKVNDVYSALAAYTASDVEELSTAMTKTASISASAGMDFANTSAFLAKIIETTRESAETAGTAMKTIVARFTEIKNDPNAVLDNEDGTTVTLNKIQSALASVGVSLTDEEGQIRNLDAVFMDLARKWDTLDTNTQRYIATISAGSRQQSRFIAMMSDYERTMELVEIANDSAGASQKQFDKTTESLEFKITRLSNAWDQFTQNLANNKAIKIVVDSLTWILTAINDIVTVGGVLKGTAASFLMTLTLIINTFGILKSQLDKRGKGTFALLKKLINPKEIADGVKKGIEQAGVEVKPTVEKMGQDFEAAGKRMGKGMVSSVEEAMPEVKAAINGTTSKKPTTLSGKYKVANNKNFNFRQKSLVNSPNSSLPSIDTKPAGEALAKTISKETQKATKVGFKQGFKNLGSSVKGFGKDLGSDIKTQLSSPLSKISAVVTAITLVAEGYKALIDFIYVTTDEKLESVNQALDTLQANIEKTQNTIDNIDNLKNSVNDYEKNLSILNKGTADYIKNQRQLNSTIRGIIEENPEMREYTNFENGRYVLDDKFWDEYEKRLGETLKKQQQEENFLIESQSRLNYEKEREEMINTEVVSGEEEQQKQSNAAIAAVIGGALVAVIAGIATGGAAIPVIIAGFAGAAASGGLGFLFGNEKQYNSKQVDRITKLLSETYGTMTEEDINKLSQGQFRSTEEEKKLLFIFGNNIEALKEYFTALKGNSEAVNNSIKALEANTDALNGMVDEEGKPLIEGAYTKEALNADKADANAIFQANRFFGNVNNNAGYWDTKLVNGKTRKEYMEEVGKNNGLDYLNGKWYKGSVEVDIKQYAQEAAELYANDYVNAEKKKIPELAENQSYILGKEIKDAYANNEDIASIETMTTEQDNTLTYRNYLQGLMGEEYTKGIVETENANLYGKLIPNIMAEVLPEVVDVGEETQELQKDLFNLVINSLPKEKTDYDTAYHTIMATLENFIPKIEINEDTIGAKLFNSGIIKSLQSALKLNKLYDENFFNEEDIERLRKEIGDEKFNEILNNANLETEDGIRNFVNSLETNGANIENLFEMSEEKIVDNFSKITSASSNAAEKLKQLGANAEFITDIFKNGKNGFTQDEKEILEKINPSLANEFSLINGKYYYSGKQALTDSLNTSTINAKGKTAEEINDILAALMNLKDYNTIYDSKIFTNEQKDNSLRALARYYGASNSQIKEADSPLKLYSLVKNLSKDVADIEKAQVAQELEKRTYDALIKIKKDQIETRKEINNTIKETEDKIVSNMEKSLSLQKQAIDNEKTQNEIDQKKNRLAVLKSTGGSASEIKELEDEIAESEQNQFFTLTEQSINSLKEENEKAQAQRDRLIKISEEQLKNYQNSEEIWNDVNDLLKNAFDENHELKIDSELVETLKKAEEYTLLSENGKKIFNNSLNTAAKTFAATLKEGIKQVEIIDPKTGDTFGKIQFYKTGGLNTVTGPAWLDGTPSKPEIVLNAQDTKNFLKLRDVLRNNFNTGSTQKGGDNYFSVNISVDSISSDYDVHKIAQQVRKEITADSRFRNVITVK